MKKNFLIALGIFASTVVIIVSCSKNYSNQPVSTDPSGLNTLFADIRPGGQTLTIHAGTTCIVSCTNGTILHFYPNSFKDANGNIITSGTVNLQLTEMYTPGSMIANHATTMSASGQLLQSGGQLNISASINGQEVFANKYGLQFLQTASSTQPMNLFFGNTKNQGSITTWDAMADTNLVGTTAAGTTGTGGLNYYIFDSCTSFGFVNCDHFCSDSGTLTSVSVVVPDNTFNLSNTELYLILPTSNCVLSNVEGFGSSSGYDASTNTIGIVSESQVNIVPVGMAYKLVAITKKGNSYYYYQTTGTVTPNLKITASMSAAETATQVKSQLTAL